MDDSLVSSLTQPDVLRSSLKKSTSTQNQLDRIPSNRTYGIQINPNEQVLHYLEPYTPQRPLSSYLQRSIPDLPSMSNTHRPATVNHLKINLSTPSIQQKKVTIQLTDEPSVSQSIK
jgi:hypothetical protein